MRRVITTQFPTDPVVDNAGVLGVAIRAARTSANMTLQDAAAFVGVAKQTLSDLERGKPSVSLGLALKIAEGLGVTLLVVPAAHRTRARQRLLGHNG